MRILLAIHNTYTDHTSGAARSMRTLMQWLAQAGHACEVLATTRFDARPPADLEAHFAELAVPIARRPAYAGRCPLLRFTLNGVPVTTLLTRRNDSARPDARESEQFLRELDRLLVAFAPSILLSYGGHPLVAQALERARAHAITTAYTLRTDGYEDRAHFRAVDHVFTCSPFLSEHYRRAIGLVSTGIESPIEWQEVLAPVESRAFVTFVNPAVHKGLALFARLADMLGQARPDIPLLVVHSAGAAGSLNSIPGIDFTRYPQIMAAPATPRPADWLALTRLLLVPSVFAEPFGRVVPEALINGIPPLVSDRGALPQTAGGAGRVLPLPDWMIHTQFKLPSAEEVEPWFDAVCELWDDPERYRQASQFARRVADERYAEAVQRRRYLDYFASLKAGGRVFE